MRNLCWLDLYPPRSVSDLAVYPTKVKAIQKWILNAVAPDPNMIGAQDIGKHSVLVLCGNSGGGKSTTVQLLCKEMHIECVEWSDDMWESQFASNKHLNFATYTHSSKTMSADLEDFIAQSAFPSLQMTTIGTKINDVKDPYEISRTHSSDKSKMMKKIILFHSPPFEHLKNGEADKISKMGGDWLLLFRDPVVVILSDVSGSDDMHYAAEHALHLNVEKKRSLNLDVIYCNPLTALRIAKTLQRMAIDACSDHSRHNRINRAPGNKTMYRPSDDDIRDIAESCLGDIRHAVIQLQMLCIYKSDASNSNVQHKQSSKASQHKKKASFAAESSKELHRDTSYSSLHGVGKLLHSVLDEHGRLSSDMDHVVERSEFPVDMSLAFLQYHCIESIVKVSQEAVSGKTEFDDLSLEASCMALDCITDAGIFWDRQFESGSNMLGKYGGNSIDGTDTRGYPCCYTVALCSRAISVARSLLSKTKMSRNLNVNNSGDLLRNVSCIRENIIDLTEINDDEECDLFESARSNSMSRSTKIKGPLKKKSKVFKDTESIKNGSNSFIKLTRPKVLDLRRSKEISKGRLLRFRNDIFAEYSASSGDVMFTEFERLSTDERKINSVRIMKSFLPIRELCTVVIPLLRETINISDRNCSLNYHVSLSGNGDYNPVIFMPTYLRKLIESIFCSNGSQNNINGLYTINNNNAYHISSSQEVDGEYIREESLSVVPHDGRNLSQEDSSKVVLVSDDIEEFEC